MNLKIKKELNSLNITFENISLIEAILVQSNISYFTKTSILVNSENELYSNEEIKKSKNFESFNSLNWELKELIKNNSSLKDYLTPISQLSSLEILLNEKDLVKLINIISGFDNFESKEILKNLVLELKNLWYSLEINSNYLQNTKKLKDFILYNYWSESDDEEVWLYQWIESKEKVNIIFEWDFDNQIITSILYKNLENEWLSFEECIDIVENMDNSDKDVLFRLALWDRKKWDTLPIDFINSTIMIDLILDLKSYLELSKTTWFNWIFQKCIPFLWYDYPEFIENNEDLKEKFNETLTQITIFWKENLDDSEISFYNWTLLHLIRTTFELNPITFVEFLEKDFENNSIKEIQEEIYKEFKKLSPIFARYIKIIF